MKHSFLCNNCKTKNCSGRDTLNDIFDKPKDCSKFSMKSMCYFCKVNCEDRKEEELESPFLCGSFKHKKGYYVSIV
jgi:hypothetical protein